MKGHTRLILLTALAVLCTIAFLGLASENAQGYFKLHNGYMDHTEVHLYWGEYEYGDADHYKVYRDTVHIGTVAGTAERRFQDTGVGTDVYEYEVKAYDNSGAELDGQQEPLEVDTQYGGGQMLFDVTVRADESPYNFSNFVSQAPGVEIFIEQNAKIKGGSVVNVTSNQRVVENITIQGGLRFKYTNGLIVRNCKFNITGSKYIPPGLQILGGNDTRLYLNEFIGYNPGALPFDACPIMYGGEQWESFTCENATIYKNTFRDNYYCIGTWNIGNSSIRDNVFDNNFASITVWGDSYNIKVFHNNFSRNWGGAIVFRDNTDPYGQCWGHHIYENEFYKNEYDIYVKGDVILVENNTSLGGEDGYELDGDDNTVVNNVLEGVGDESYFGVECSGERAIVAYNNVSKYHWGINLADNDPLGNSSIYDNILLECSEYGIAFSGYEKSYGNRIWDNYVAESGFDAGRFKHWAQGGGIYLVRSMDIMVDNNTLEDNEGEGITVHYYCGNVTIQHNEILNNENNGIRLWPQYTFLDKVNIHHNNITGNTLNGIFIWGKDDLNDGYSHVDNVTIVHNNLSGNGYSGVYDNAGVWIELSHNITVENNLIHHEGDYGVYILGSEDYPCFHIKVNDNNISRDHEQDGWGLVDDGKWWPKVGGGEFTDNRFGLLYPTRLSAAGHHDTLKLAGVEDPPTMPSPPEFDPAQTHMGCLIEVVYDGSHNDLWLQMFYKDEQIKGFHENELIVWKHNISGWDKDENNEGWKKSVEHNQAINYFIVELETTGKGWINVIAPLRPLLGGRTVDIVIDKVTGTVEPGVDIQVEGTIEIVPDGSVKEVKLYLDGTFSKMADTFSDTAFSSSLPLPVGLTEGKHTITAEAILTTGESDTDDEDINYATGPVTYTVTVTIDEPPEEIKPDADITVKGSITVEPAATVTAVRFFFKDSYKNDASTFSNTDYTGTLKLPADLAAGDHGVMVEVKIEPGSEGYANRCISYYAGPGSYTITVVVNEPPEEIKPDAVITVTGTIEVTPAATVTAVKFYLDGNYMAEAASFDDTSYTGPMPLPGDLAEGDHTLTVRVVIESGNSDTGDRVITYTEKPKDEGGDDGFSPSPMCCGGLFMLLLLLLLLFLYLKDKDEKEGEEQEVPQQPATLAPEPSGDGEAGGTGEEAQEGEKKEETTG